MRGWVRMAIEAIEWLKTIAAQLDTQTTLLQALVVGQQRTQQQIMTISQVYIKAGEAPSDEQVALEVARLVRKKETSHD